MTEMKIHELAKYFPIIEGEAFDKFVEDIKKNGQLEPIVLFQGQILDGVNRYRACKKLGIEPVFKDYNGTDPLRYVISINVHRRHMTASQLAMVATEMLPEFEEEAKKRMTAPMENGRYGLRAIPDKDKGLSSDHVAQEFGISGKSVRRAKRVKEQAPEKVADIISGKENIRSVDTELRMKAEAERKARAVAEGRTEKTKIELRIEEQQYIQILESIISKLPTYPPKDWSQEFFGVAKGYANIIINRLEVFNE